jgi:hypothetical protein
MHFLPCLIGKLWWIGPLCRFQFSRVPSALCGARPVITDPFIHFLLRWLLRLEYFVGLATSLIWTTVGSATYQ